MSDLKMANYHVAKYNGKEVYVVAVIENTDSETQEVVVLDPTTLKSETLAATAVTPMGFGAGVPTFQHGVSVLTGKA